MLKKFTIKRQLLGLPPTSAEMKAFITHEWADDPILYLALKHSIDVANISRIGESILADITFYSHSADVECGDYSLKLFELEKENGGFFPCGILRLTMTINYIWEDSISCDVLDNKKYTNVEDGISSSEFYEWDDPNLPDDVFIECIGWFDEMDIAASLLELHGDYKAIPDFYPKRLMPFFNKCIANYLASKI